MKRLPYKPVMIKPGNGLLEHRGTADEVPTGSWRYLTNWEVTQKSKLCRASGNKRLMGEQFDNNADLHDQLQATLREPITFLWSFRTAIGLDKLFAGTQNRLYAFNNATGNWRLIGDGFGTAEDSTECGEHSWWAGGFGDVVVFTNGLTGGCVWHIIDQPNNADGQGVQAIKDLALLKIRQVGFVTQWAGLTFYCNLVEDGTRKSYRIIWSDFENPISLKPKASVSLAGSKNLDFGEVVLNAVELGNSLLFYTNLGIWVCDAGSGGVSFSKRYSAERPGDRTLAYPKTLISTGSEHFYLGNDGIYSFNFYIQKPERIDWIHKGSSVIFEDINAARCMGHCAGYETAKKQIKISWARTGESCPTQTLVINTEYPFLSIEDQGATAYANYSASRQYSLRQFILDQCICTPADLEAAGYGFVREGGYCRPGMETLRDCTGVKPTCFWTTEEVDMADEGDTELLVEDFDMPVDPASLCARLAGLTVADVCEAEMTADQCASPEALIFAATIDKGLKECDPNAYYREVLTNALGCGAYEKRGYISLLRSGPMDFGVDVEKILSRVDVQAYPVEQTIPSQIVLKVGAANDAVDPNTANQPGSRCVIKYQPEEEQPLICGDLSLEEAVAENVNPDKDMAWAVDERGANLYFELSIRNDEVTPKHTGGACCVSKITLRVAGKS